MNFEFSYSHVFGTESLGSALLKSVISSYVTVNCLFSGQWFSWPAGSQTGAFLFLLIPTNMYRNIQRISCFGYFSLFQFRLFDFYLIISIIFEKYAFTGLAFLQISYISIFYISNFISILPIFKLLFKLMKRFILKGVTKQKFCSMKFDIFLDIFSS